ncbi:MAG: hypothetical protein GF418_14090 [Chitinivibrionales bacterium]|nr:hypothetical protein [Chitinivibrionales bacterium]MBD3396749.1 hypothetical protein [Chitinivibrionales bacterium]
MVRYNLDDVTDDMILGESIMLPSGKLLLGAGYRVSGRYRDRLKKMGFRSILIQEPGTEDVRPSSVVNERDQAALADSVTASGEKIEQIVGKFREERGHDMHKMLFSHRKDLNRFVMSPTIARQLETIIDQIMNQPQIVLNMAALKDASGSFFERAVNVTVTALCIGRKARFSYEEIKQLATGALNYHLGLIAIPKGLLNKSKPLTEEEKALYRQHTVYGYLILAQNPQIPPTSAIVALQHHELQNGSGYPLGLKGANAPPVKDISKTHVIHRFAEIVAVADSYHALGGESGDGGIDDVSSTRTAIKKLIGLGGEYLNREIIKALVSIIPVYPVGTRVRITEAPSGRLKQYLGVVARDNPDELSRPVILLYKTIKGQKIDPPIVLDTAKSDAVKFELAV